MRYVYWLAVIGTERSAAFLAICGEKGLPASWKSSMIFALRLAGRALAFIRCASKGGVKLKTKQITEPSVSKNALQTVMAWMNRLYATVRCGAFFLTIASILTVAGGALAADSSGFFNVTHMANTAAAVNYGIQNGSNGVEIDLNFDASGNPLDFEHGGPCDCTCGILGICTVLKGGCTASTKANVLLNHIAGQSQLALVVIDSKVPDLSKTALSNGGAKVIALLDNQLFSKGYTGNAIIGVSSSNSIAYLQAAVAAAKSSKHGYRYYFSIDEESNAPGTIQKLVNLNTPNRVYGTGVSACGSGNYYDEIVQGHENMKAGVIGSVYVWTLDKQSSMNTYIDRGVRGILTNHPSNLTKVLRDRGIALAHPGSSIPLATSNTVITGGVNCDCNYHPGGCSISSAAPSGMACECSYKGGWTCGGDVVTCKDPNSPFCKKPDKSIKSCVQGGGDCEGYKNVTCDCDYHPGGCMVSKAAVANTACDCSYKGGWTCGGAIVPCTDPNSPFCKKPDKTIKSCVQGGGDCEGYKNATCDCDYHPGGCTISNTAPSFTACACSYKGAWTCGGSVTKCSDEKSPYCKNPDKSLNSCLQGGGDCEGY